MSSRKTPLRWSTAAVAGCLALLLVAPPGALAAEGDDDPTFDTDGSAYLALPGASPSSTFVAELPGGKVLGAVVDWDETFVRSQQATDTHLHLARFGPGGALEADDAFQLPQNGAEILDLRVLADGRQVVVGFLMNDAERRMFTFVRRPDGATALTLTTGPTGCNVIANGDAAIRSDGGIVALYNGCDLGGGAVGGSVLRRFALDAGDDLTPVFSDVPTWIDEPDLVLDGDELELGADDAIVVLGRVHGRIVAERGAPALNEAVQRYDENGVLDAGFGDAGTFRFTGLGEALAVGSDGRVVISLQQPFGDTIWQLLGLTPGGAPDPAFGVDGVAELDHPELCCAGPTALRVQADGKVLALLGLGRDASHQRVLARVTRAGALDQAFAGDGVRTFDLRPEGQLDTRAAPIQVASGAVVVPFTAGLSQPGRIAPPTTLGNSLGLFRLAAPPAPPPAPPTTTPSATPAAQTAPAPAATPAPTSPVTVASKACTSRRSFKIRLRTGRTRRTQSPIVSADVRVNGKKVTVSRESRRRSTVNLTSLPKGRFSVTIRLRLADGGIVRETRRYRTCAPKVERELAPLRTRPPGGRG
jgi:uncharacterized delta-60 repeat protein